MGNEIHDNNLKLILVWTGFFLPTGGLTGTVSLALSPLIGIFVAGKWAGKKKDIQAFSMDGKYRNRKA
jgi:hypothetical protein